MTPKLPAGRLRSACLGLVVVAAAVGVTWADRAAAQASAPAPTPATGPAAAPVPAPQAVKAPAAVAPGSEQGPRWSELKPAQQLTLRPLQQEWAGIDSRQKQKWLALATRFQKLTPEEQGRIQARMSEWTKMSTRQRAEARLNYQEAKQLPRADREARWKAYQALSPEERAQLAARAAAANRSPVRSSGLAGKSGVNTEPEYAAHPRPIGAIEVQAAPGATTTLLTRRPTPPGHQQSGMPKIAATPEFVNKSTLLPQRGPQGAATRSTSASGAPARP